MLSYLERWYESNGMEMPDLDSSAASDGLRTSELIALSVAAASALLMVVGSLGVWVESSAGAIFGADGIGWIGAGLGIVAAFATAIVARFPPRRKMMIFAAAIGVAGVVSAWLLWCVLKLVDRGAGLVTSLIPDWEAKVLSVHSPVSPGWGLYLLFWASVCLTASSSFAMTRQTPDRRRGSGVFAADQWDELFAPDDRRADDVLR